MMPAVPVPRSAGIKIPVEIKLKPRYRYDASKRVFESGTGERFRPDQRRIGIKHNHVAAVLIEGGARREHRVGRPALGRLDENLSARRDRPGLAHNSFHFRSDND